MNGFPLLTVMTLTPLLGACAVAALPSRHQRLARRFGLGFSLVALAWALVLCAGFQPEEGIQFQEQHGWMRAPLVQYYVGVDGLGLLMVLLTALIVPFALLASGNIATGAKLYYALFLLLQSGLFGAFTALNFFHWFIYWELSLVPAFFLIKLWGGPQRSRAAMQFFVYTLVGSVAMLLAFQAIYLATGTFDLIQLGRMGQSGELTGRLGAALGWKDLTTQRLALVIGAGVFLGLAVKVPVMPFHTWLPPAYAEAPTGVSMVLTGALSKMGVYGFLRILAPLFRDQLRLVLTPLLWLAIFTIVASAWAALAQKDLKRTLAYSSINHLGYCLLGLFAVLRLKATAADLATDKAAALNGVLLQMFNHGLSAATLFCFVGYLENRSGGLRGLNDFGGLRKILPVFCGLMGIAMFSSLGLPGLNGFVGEFLIFKGTFTLAGWAAALSTLGLLLTAVFLLTILQRVFSGPLNEQWRQVPDLTPAERAVVLPAVALMFILGLYPQLLIRLINPTVTQLVYQLGS